MVEKVLWGWHLSVNASGCNLERMQDRETLNAFIKRLVVDIDMIAFGEPDIVWFGNGNKSGFTLSQLISTSNICAHFSDDLCAIFLDVFSCKEFDQQTVLNLVSEYFGAQSFTVSFQERWCDA